jgi:anthranilate synthase/aminodeoxychorismate synthase-like glutamine amidotransferase
MRRFGSCRKSKPNQWAIDLPGPGPHMAEPFVERRKGSQPVLAGDEGGLATMAQIEPQNRIAGHIEEAGIVAQRRDLLRAYDASATQSGRLAKRSILIIDNYDSFVYNIVQWLRLPRSQIHVSRNDSIGLDGVVNNSDIAGVIISPGPMGPAEAGISNELIAALAPTGTPILGICLGHQCIGHVYGATVARHPIPTHGKATLVRLESTPLFEGLPRELLVGRYHSLHVVDSNLASRKLTVTARNMSDGTVMGLRHVQWPVFGVQFHPESILTGAPGRRILDNFVSLAMRHSNFGSLRRSSDGSE